MVTVFCFSIIFAIPAHAASNEQQSRMKRAERKALRFRFRASVRLSD